MTTSGRFYFQRGGQELTAHPLNGAVVSGTGPFVDVEAANKSGAMPFDRRRTSIFVFDGKREREVTAADFDGAVCVLEWWPERDATQRFILVEK